MAEINAKDVMALRVQTNAGLMDAKKALQEARDVNEKWRMDYNKDKPHGSLGGLIPDEFAKQYETMVRNSQETLIQGAL